MVISDGFCHGVLSIGIINFKELKFCQDLVLQLATGAVLD